MPHILTFEHLCDYGTASPRIIVPVTLSVGAMRERCVASLDTGSENCLFKKGHGEALGLEIEAGDKKQFRTVAGHFWAYGHTITLSTFGWDFDVPVYFSEDPNHPRNVLGRLGWLRNVRVAIVDYEGKLYASRY